jgi:hypothetical protein
MESQSEFAFIVTSKVTSITQKHLLLECIRHIRIIYPEHTIYLINDNSNISLFPTTDLMDYNVEIIESIVKNGGEINPYLFILDDRCRYDSLLYLHDSVFIKKQIDHLIDHNFVPIWYSTKYIWNDIFIPENMDILTQMVFYNYKNTNMKINLYELLLCFKKSNNFLVTFGAMSYFNKKFVEFIRDNTNFFSIVNNFKNRHNRCLFERIISCIYILMYDQMYRGVPKLSHSEKVCLNFGTLWYPKSMCGDIIYHPSSFKNTEMYIHNYNSYFIKVWQGR